MGHEVGALRRSVRFGAAAMLCIGMATALSQPARASISEAAVRFLLTPLDIRSRALGEAGVCLPDMAFALDVNPALLLQTHRVTAGFGRDEWVPQFDSDNESWSVYGSVGPDLIGSDSGLQWAFGAGYKRLTLDEGIRVNEFGNVFGSFQTGDEVATLGGALGLGSKFRLGVSAKYIRSVLEGVGSGATQFEVEATGWAVDVGLHVSGLLPQATLGRSNTLWPESNLWRQMQIPRSPGLGLGVAVQNLGPEMSYIDAAQADPLPRVLRAGASYRIVDTDYLGILSVGEFLQSIVSSEDFFRAGEYRLNWGFEVGLLRFVDLRWGGVYEEGRDDNDQTMGIGLGFERIRFDYTRKVPASSTEEINLWSVNVRW